MRYLARVDALRAEANAIGVEGIRTFGLGNLAINGAQRYEVFERFAERGAVRKGGLEPTTI
jgi:predicted DsbA family dithiol-disulfide isomerase